MKYLAHPQGQAAAEKNLFTLVFQKFKVAGKSSADKMNQKEVSWY
jgi:hypothetical protein